VKRAGLPGWAIAIAVLSLGAVAAPILALLARADWRTLPATLATPVAWQALGLTALTASAATAACLVFGVPTALVLSRCPPGLARWLRAGCLIPLVLPPMVSGVALLSWLGRRGLAGQVLELAGIRLPFTTVGVVIAQTFVAWPFLVVGVEAALRAGAGDHERVGASLGAGPTRVFFTVTWPRLLPGLRAGVVLCFARAVGEFGATALFAGNLPGVTQTMSLAIYSAFNGGAQAQQVAIGLSVVLVVLAVGLLAASGRLRVGGGAWAQL
jgi:molybdate transport system permease protein